MATIDLNQSPYFDDYDADKNYLRVLFKPSVAVQARELTQIQTSLQRQIEDFGRHIFQNGTIVLGGAFDVQTGITVATVEVTGQTQLDAIIGTTIEGGTSTLKAYVVHGELDTNTVGLAHLYIRYKNSTVATSVFTSGETVSNNNESVSVISTGNGTLFSISEGVVFMSGYFIKFPKLTTGVSFSDSTPNAKVYFKNEFSIVDSNEDISLLDNANGFNNYAAPGADRLAAEISLEVTASTVTKNEDDYSLLLELQNGEVRIRNERTDYARLYDEIAKRTYDESGDYVVRGMDVFTREHLNTGTNEGLYTAAEGGNNDLLAVGIERGLAYVKGYEINNLLTSYVEIPKASTYINVENQTSYARGGNYIIVDEIRGLPNTDFSIPVNLYDTAENRVTNANNFSDAATGSVVGTARVNAIEKYSGTLGDPKAQAKLYLTDVVMNANQSLADIRAVGNTASFFADTVLDTNDRTLIYDTNLLSRLYYTGSEATRDTKSEAGTYDFSFTFNRRKTGINFNSSGEVTVNITTTGETIPYTSPVSDNLKNTILVTLTGDATATQAGTVSITAGNTIVTGSGTSFTNLNVGDRIQVGGSDLYYIDSITNDTVMEISENAGSSVVANTFTKYFKSGDLLDLTAKGSSDGTERTVTVANTTSFSIDVKENFGASVNCVVVHRAVRNDAEPAQKTLKTSYVRIDGSSVANTEFFPLGFSDVYDILEVRKDSSTFTTSTQGTDVTDDYTLARNQTSWSYETSYLGTTNPITGSEHLLVKLRYFEPDYTPGIGYFSIDSYDIDDTTESASTIKTIDIPTFNGINLRNIIDMRPVKSATATQTETVTSATINPTESSTYISSVDGQGLRIAAPDTTLVYDYSYYLPRYDVMVIDKKGNYKSIQGEPKRRPPIPTYSDNVMGLAYIYVPPYPSLAETYARKIGKESQGSFSEKITFARYTMRDIGNIRKRVKNLEYYAALSLIEQQTLDLELPDNNGLNRFKNGIFVDVFADHSLADSGHPDYRIAVDPQDKIIRPVYDMEGVDMRYDAAGSTNVSLNKSLISLPYTERTLIDQPRITTFRNIEQGVFRYIGELTVDPGINSWVDTNTVDRILKDDFIPSNLGMSTEWGAWQTSGSGGTAGSPTWKVYVRAWGEDDNDFNSGLADSYSSSGTGSLNTADKRALANNTQAEQQAATQNDPNAHRFVGEFATQQEARAYAQSNLSRYFIVEGGTQTEIEMQTRTGIETTLSSKEELTELGNFVTDVSWVPYIKPQVIRLYARGLKADTQFFVYFDGEDMTDYVTPVGATTLDANTAASFATDATQSSDLTGIGTEGDDLYSDEFGIFVGFLRLPEEGKRFRTGTKPIVITDSPTNAVDATSYAEDYFVSNGLLLQKQNTIQSTRTIITDTRTITDSREITKTLASPQQVKEYGPSCMAYSFYVDQPGDVEGVFLTSVDVFVQSMDAELGMWFEIREMTNDGGITRNMIPFSKVWMTRDDPRINITADGSTPTNVNFEAPVYLQNKTQYAFLIHTEGLNPDTYFWVSRLGETDLNTGNQVTGRQLTGTTYVTNNNLNWDPVPDVDLTCTFYYADFDTSLTGTVSIINEDIEFLSGVLPLSASSNTFFRPGEPIKGTEIIEINKTAGADTVAIGDIIRDANTGLEATVLDVDGTEIYTDAHDFVLDNDLDIYDSGNTVKDITSTVSSIDFGTGIIRKIRRNEGTFMIDHSNGRFFVGSELRSLLPDRYETILNGTYTEMSYTGLTTSTIPNKYFPQSGFLAVPVGQSIGSGTYPSFTIDSFDTYDYSALEWRPSSLVFDGTTTLTYTHRGVINTTLTTATSLAPHELVELKADQNILSRSEEVAQLAGEKSFKITATMTSSDDRLSSILDNDTLNVVLIENELGNSANNELLPYSNSNNAVYMSQIIELNDDNDAEDLVVFLEEYRPSGSEIRVYARLLNKYDTEELKFSNWFEMETTKSITSSPDNRENFIDTQYSVPAAMKTGLFNEVQYTSTNGNVYTGYRAFQIKIVLLGDNPALYPKGSRLRAIALQV